MVSKTSAIVVLAALLAITSQRTTWAQTTIDVNDGATLLVSHLQAGNFLGTPFSLGPDTTFEINSGGQFGERGTALYDNTLNYMGVVMNVNAGGRFSNCIDPDCGIVTNLQLNMYDGGSISSILQMGDGTVANIHGGSLGRVIAEDGSVLNLLGGNARYSLLSARQGSTLNVAAGGIRNIDVAPGSDVTFVGGEFKLNGAEYTDPTISLAVGDVFSGTFQDGSVFIITPAPNLSYAEIKLQTATLPDTAASTYIVDGSPGVVPLSLRSGESLILREGGQIGGTTGPSGMFAVGATIEIEGGWLGQSSRVVDSVVNVSDGSIGNRFEAYGNSTVTVTGGVFQGDAWAGPGSTWNLHGGTLGHFLTAFENSAVNVFGGDLGSGFTAQPGSVANIHGGTMSDLVLEGGTTTLFVQSALLNGVPLELELGLPLEITERGFGSILDVVLADGSPLSISLAPEQAMGPAPFVDPDASLLLVAVVPEPATLFVAVALSGLGISLRTRLQASCRK